MVFKKGHKPIRKSSSKKQNESVDVSDFFVKFGIKNEMQNNLSKLSYYISELKKDLGIINNFREKKAFLRKDLYETLISLRLNLDSLSKHMPSKEFEALKKKIAEISKFTKENKIEKKVEKPKPIPKPMVKEEKVVEVKPIEKPVVEEKKEDIFDNASDSERKELEKLKKDLEDISKELSKKDF